MDRRSFLGTVTAATLLTRRLGWAANDHKIGKIGVQLYTVRSEIAKDFEGSLAKVASIGYQEVELAGFTMKDGKVSYYNRWFEYLPVNGKLPYDILLEECDPDLVKMELDLCWITLGGQDPVKYFDRYPGRFPLVHVKALTSVPPITAAGEQNFGDSMKEMTEVGR